MERFAKEEALDRLILEREVLSKGGYGCSVRTPWMRPRYLRDSITCLNFGSEEKRHPCSGCFLFDHVPADKREEDIPCHHIPLNARGDTVDSLDQHRDRSEVEATLLAWLDALIEDQEPKRARDGAQSSFQDFIDRPVSVRLNEVAHRARRDGDVERILNL